MVLIKCFLFVIIILLTIRFIYLCFDDTNNLKYVDRNNLYRTIYNSNKLALCNTSNFEDDEYDRYISNIEKKIIKTDNYLRYRELKIDKNQTLLTIDELKKNLKKIDRIYQHLSNIDNFVFKIPILEELNDRITFYYKFMNDNEFIKIKNIPVYQFSKHNHAVEYLYKNIKSIPGTILHVDTHADMNEIKNDRILLRKYIKNNELNVNINDIINDIGGVLVPMLLPYDKNKGVFWLTPDWVTEPYNSSNIKLSINEDKSYFYGGNCPKYTVKVNKQITNNNDLDVEFTTSNVHYADNMISKISDKYILNIDLDYFVCYGTPCYGIEGNDAISHYRTKIDLGYALKDDCEYERVENEIYYEMQLILKRIDNFIEFIRKLKENNKTPSMIIICDSTRVNFSNYNFSKKYETEIYHEFMPKYLCFWVHNIITLQLKKIL